jgi:hypothetical protein
MDSGTHRGKFDSLNLRHYLQLMPTVTEAQTEETERRIANDEAAWDRLFSQAEKVRRLADWAQDSLIQHSSEPMDESRV